MQTIKVISKSAILLAFVAFCCTIISGGIYFLTKDKIKQAIQAQQQELLLQVIPQDYFNNDLTQACYAPQAGTLQVVEISKICTAKKDGVTTAYAFESTAHDGYSGDIHILVGMKPDGEVLGVRITEHHETPGLGDKIETRISNWVLSFDHQVISNENAAEWAVKKDGGKFDQFAGATITPRAVVNQVKRAALAMLDNLPKERESDG
ncbi:electron transport complex subunit RsxG [Aggregatibacter actinomycetemcomitans]|uniref:electron transport complex subunit RsxG n=1 Tax=Aggregatibacter actinomycetemcomitans TaxID=714 RepID=UPI0011DB8C3D|nr:electron transport complex subunit RsxG [Aggregatibacter actinomycetemcomitans]TYA37151.1 electron transport complex subunit RsxG [Aggregatibacter actinomycetemcomitans]TYB20236.1 electron transport complex subunit RsxG [Aggregatibacter actinomycetemcomitans]